MAPRPFQDLAAPESAFARLREACRPAWESYSDHAFVRGMADGSLPEAAFRHYLVQDYLFLVHFSRAYALAVFKSDNVADMREKAAGLDALLNTEMKLHVGYCRGWGLSEADMAAAPEATATMAYTRYVLERGLAGDILDLEVALAPCVIGYGEIANRMLASPALRLAGNPYRDWIAMYAAEDYQALARSSVERLDRLVAARGGAARFPALVTTFDQATRLEAAFWQMGLDRAT
ncbi:MAG: thiaminase II [Alphaproteobacteria bacterium]|nr:thiaminase II [Alphaproteobacteria bacterium]